MNITLNDALKQMELKDPFQLKFVTLNRSEKTGGEIIELTNAVKVGANFNMKNNDMINLKQLNNSHHPHAVHIHLITEFNRKNVMI